MNGLYLKAERKNCGKYLILTGFLIAVLLGCGINDKKAVESTNPGQVKEIKIEASKYQFAPDTISVKKGENVKITATTKDVTHGFMISGYGINQEIVSGKETIIEFTADKTGTFDIICSIYCGEGHGGMKGKLIVTE